MDENIILSAKGLDLWYGPTQALKGVSMDIPEKQVTALIGPSGCGKSTFLKTLDRMNDLVPGIKITGSVQYRGQEIYAPNVDVTWLRKQIGMVFQKPNPFPMSIYDNIAADVVKRCEIIAHQGQCQRRFTTAGLTCYTEGFSLLNLQGDSVYGVYIFMKTSYIFRFQIVYFQHYFSHSCLLSLLTAG